MPEAILRQIMKERHPGVTDERIDEALRGLQEKGLIHRVEATMRECIEGDEDIGSPN